MYYLLCRRQLIFDRTLQLSRPSTEAIQTRLIASICFLTPTSTSGIVDHWRPPSSTRPLSIWGTAWHGVARQPTLGNTPAGRAFVRSVGKYADAIPLPSTFHPARPTNLTMKNPLLLLCLASWAFAMVINRQESTGTISGPPWEPSATLSSFFASAPGHLANALKNPQTVWSSSRVLPVFWDDGSGHGGGASSSSICRHRVGRWICALLAGASLLAIALAGCTLMVLVAICVYQKVCGSRCPLPQGVDANMTKAYQSRRRGMGVQLPIAEVRVGHERGKAFRFQ